MYRAVGWKALKTGVSLTDEDAITRLAERSLIDVLPVRVTIDDEDVTRAIRTPEIDRAAAAVNNRCYRTQARCLCLRRVARGSNSLHHARQRRASRL
jgi:cytidylate kinase